MSSSVATRRRSGTWLSLLLILALASSFLLPSRGAQAANAGSALQFNGSSQYVTLGTSSDLRPAQFTLELWFKRATGGVTQSTGTGGVTAYPLITKGRAEAETAAADVNYFFGIDASGHLAADFEEAQSGPSPSLNHPVTGASVIATDNTWHHGAATYDGIIWKLYLDGNVDASATVSRPANTASTVITAVGTSLNSVALPTPGGFFAGTIDEARIWSVARTQAQIQAAMNSEITSGTGLLGRWGMNEGSGTVVGNSVDRARPGRLQRLPQHQQPSADDWDAA